MRIKISMKKYSTEYFEKKFNILFDKLIIKDGFLDAVKNTRKELKIPENGFENEVELAEYFLGKMYAEEQEVLSFLSFLDDYSIKKNVAIDDKNKAEVIKTYIKTKGNQKERYMRMVLWLIKGIANHDQIFTQNILFKKNKFLSKLFPKTFELTDRFWGLDLLDEHIFGHFIEKYLFLGKYGINQYIKSKITCTNCRYIGVNHFSPNRNNMKGKNEGPFGKNYIFNKETVKLLSLHFNSVFLIIKPYATKEEVVQYVKDNWESLKEHIIEKNTFYKQFDVHPSKIKESDSEKSQLIYELYKLPKKELLKKYKGEENLSGPDIYKEKIISCILWEEYNINMSQDAIKKTATRFAKSMEVRKRPKDIRDI